MFTVAFALMVSSGLLALGLMTWVCFVEKRTHERMQRDITLFFGGPQALRDLDERKPRD